MICICRTFAGLAFVTLIANAAQAQVRIMLPAWKEAVLMDSMKVEQALRAAPEAVYAAVLRAYADLEIPTGNTDNIKGIIGSEVFEKIHRFVGATLSRSFSCGDSANGPNADSYRLSIAVVTWVAPGANGGTTLASATVASGRDVAGVSRVPRHCASTGAIEAKIAAAVERYLK